MNNDYLESKVLTVKTKLDFRVISSILFFLLCFVVNIEKINSYLSSSNFRLVIVSVGLYAGVIYAIYLFAWTTIGKVLITVSADSLIIKSVIFFPLRIQKFQIEKISNLRIDQNTDSSSYWGFQGVMIFNKTTALKFNYCGKNEVSFRGNFIDSDLKMLKLWISN